METIEVTLYSFSELSEEVQDKIIERESMDVDEEIEASEFRNSLNAFEKEFPVKIKGWNIGYPGTYVKFEVQHDFPENIAGRRLEKYLWNNHKNFLFPFKAYPIHSRKKISHARVRSQKYTDTYYNRWVSAITRVQADAPLTGCYTDYGLIQPIFDFLEKPDDRDLRYLMRECLESWAESFEKTLDEIRSSEYIRERLMDSDRKFLKDGQEW